MLLINERKRKGVEKNGFRFFEGDIVKVYIRGRLAYKNFRIEKLPILDNDWIFINNERGIGVHIHDSIHITITKNVLYYDEKQH